jgi:phosphatidylethanolamine-binding protein (PEBP) family uncharacterized protein
VDLGTEVPIKVSQTQPLISIVKLNGTKHLSSSETTYTLAMTDPDAPSRKDPKYGQICHWITTGIKLHFIEREAVVSLGDLPLHFQTLLQGPYLAPTDLIPYKAPAPPEKSGFHRYVLVLLRPAVGVGHEDKPLVPPSARPMWGFGKAGSGVREWAARESLEVVGANFFVVKNPTQ